MLTMTEQAWNALLTEAQTAIDRQNARCVGSYADYSHELKIEDMGEVILASAIQRQSTPYGRTYTNCLGWRKADGLLLKVTVKLRRTRKATHRTLEGKPVVAQSWAKAAAKSPKHLLDLSRLTDFIMIGDVYLAGTETVGGRSDPEAA